MLIWCLVTTAVLVTVGVIIAFLVQTPSASVSSVSFNCGGSAAACAAAASLTGFNGLIVVTVHNPNLLSADVSSDALTIQDASNSQQIGNASFSSVHVGSRGDTDISISVSFPKGGETVLLVQTVYANQQSFPVVVQGPLSISLGALSPTYNLNKDYTIPPQ